MAKARARKKKAASSSNATLARTASASTLPVPENYVKRRPARALQSSQSIFMAGVVALGCWGFAFTFAFFTQDPNRYVYAGMAALIALMWSGMFGMRVYKWQQRRSSIN